MAKWVDITSVSDLPEGEKQCTRVEGTSLIVFHHEGNHYAIENHCPHAGMPLEDGEREGRIITCPFHGYAFQIDTGENIYAPDTEPPLRTFPTRIENNTLQVNLESSPD